MLIVEDAADLSAVIAENLVAEGHETRVAGTLEDARRRFYAWAPEVVILDLLLPDGHGVEFLEELRDDGWIGPVLVLSALSDLDTKLRGFRLGADDYVTKPFRMLELLARVDNLLRRVPRSRLRPVALGHFEIDPSAREVRRDGEALPLRPRELDLLLALLARAGEVVPRRTLLVEVWGYSSRAQTRTVDWHVAELRRHLGDSSEDPRFIETVRGVGYRLRGG